jgi:hypothetical protein
METIADMAAKMGIELSDRCLETFVHCVEPYEVEIGFATDLCHVHKSIEVLRSLVMSTRVVCFLSFLPPMFGSLRIVESANPHTDAYLAPHTQLRPIFLALPFIVLL